MMWEEINDPIEAQVEAQLEEKLLARLSGTSNHPGAINAGTSIEIMKVITTDCLLSISQAILYTI